MTILKVYQGEPPVFRVHLDGATRVVRVIETGPQGPRGLPGVDGQTPDLSAYATQAYADDAAASAVAGIDLSGFATTAALAGYVQTATLAVALDGYVQNDALATALAAKADASALAGYATTQYVDAVVAGAGASFQQEIGGVWRPGRQADIGWITHPANGALTSVNVSFTLFAPLRVGAAGQYANMSCTLMLNGAAGRELRMALYRAAPDGMPGQLVADFGTADCTATGVKTLTIAPLTLDAGLYYAVFQNSTNALSFRGGQYTIDNGSGWISSGNIFQACIGRIVYLAYGDPWPADMTNHSIGTGANQIQFVASTGCPTMLLW